MNNVIRELRKENKVTQDDLAGAVGVTRQTIKSLENGNIMLLCNCIIKYFGMKIEDILISGVVVVLLSLFSMHEATKWVARHLSYA